MQSISITITSPNPMNIHIKESNPVDKDSGKILYKRLANRLVQLGEENEEKGDEKNE